MPPVSPLDPSNDYVSTPEARTAEMQAYRRMHRLIGRGVAQPSVGPAVPVILVPGFISGDVSLAMVARTLRRAGHRTFRSEIGANLGCTDAMVVRLLRRVEVVARTEGRRIALVGHSRGGMIVKLAAMRRPDLIAGIVVMAAPVTGTLSVAPHVRQQLEVLFRLNRRGFAGMISQDCVTGLCAARVVAELEGPFPPDVAYTSIYSRSDAIIDWHTCLDPAATLVEVDSSHTGMGTDLAVQGIVAERLGSIAPSPVGQPPAGEPPAEPSPRSPSAVGPSPVEPSPEGPSPDGPPPVGPSSLGPSPAGASTAQNSSSSRTSTSP